MNKSDGRAVEICRGESWQRRREELCALSDSRCQVCYKVAPLHDVYREGTDQIRWKAGHAHHKRSRGLGGAFRNDAIDGLVWLCDECHQKMHEPQKAVPGKVQL